MKRSGRSWAQRQQHKYAFLPLWPLLIVIFNRTIDPGSCRDVTSLNFRAVKAPSCFGRSSWPSWGGRRWSPASWGWRRCSKTWFWRRGSSWSEEVLDEESKVGRNACRALQLSYATEAVDQYRIFFETISEVQLSYVTEAVTIDSSWDVKKNVYHEKVLVEFTTQEVVESEE